MSVGRQKNSKNQKTEYELVLYYKNNNIQKSTFCNDPSFMNGILRME
jgi:hypothetical protein